MRPKLCMTEATCARPSSSNVGDVEAAFAAGRPCGGRPLCHAAPNAWISWKPKAALVEPTPDGGIVVRVGGQHGGTRPAPSSPASSGCREEKIEVVTSPIGGGFGGKDELTVQPPLALLALKDETAGAASAIAGGIGESRRPSATPFASA
jgi:hypothetical protein